MTDWANLIAAGDLPTLLVGLLIVLVTGGLGSTIVNSIAASRRGIRGDAISKEQTGIDGLSKLSSAQDVAIHRLDGQIIKATERIEALERRLQAEIEYSNANITHMLSLGVAPLPRNHQTIQGD